MKKLTIFSLHLGYGGIERSVVSLANLLSDTYNVKIISVYKLYDKPAFDINSNVEVSYLIEDHKPNREEWKKAVKKFRPIKIIKESYSAVVTLFLRKRRTINAIRNLDSDIVISTRDIFSNWLGEYGKKSMLKVAWEHNHHHGNEKYAEKIVKSCKNMDYLVLVSDSLRSFYKKELKLSKCKCVYIPNILDNVPDKLADLNEERLISVGRLSREKGYDDLIEVFKLVHEMRPSWNLDIIGDGAQKNLVCDKIYQYGLSDVCCVHGFQKREYIDNLLNKSSIYLMTSFTESFGIVLLEAMSHGIPCVAFDSAEGANDLIINDNNGYLISSRDKQKMADIIVKLIDNKDLRERLGKNGRQTSLRYTKSMVKKDWVKLLKR